MTTEQNSKPFLSRWSRRKLAAEETAAADNPTSAATTQVTNDLSASAATEPPSISDSVQLEEKKPLWQRDNIDPQEKQQAMRDLFRKPKFNLVDGLDEYEKDYNYHNFAKLGDVITHEMRSRLAAQADAFATSVTSTQNSDKASESSEESVLLSNNKEEKPLA